MTSPLTYEAAGVSIAAGDELVERIKPLARRTLGPGVLSGIGGFGALFEVPKGYRDPVLVSGTDGVGTKLKLAFELGKHDTIGQDLVAMSVNDILVQGAKPLFFLDYFATGKLDVDVAASVVNGIAIGCEIAGCALIGGETAEMPDMYQPGEYDLAGFAVGVVERDRIVDGKSIALGDTLLGLASSGPHANGYSLVRRVLQEAQAELRDDFLGRPLGHVLLEPTRIYCKPVLTLLGERPLKGLAHVTGGGLVENVPRILPDHLQAVIRRGSWPRPAIFDWLQRHGRIDDAEMHRVFNCGIGMAIVVAPADAQAVRERFERLGERCWEIGIVAERPAGQPGCVVL